MIFKIILYGQLILNFSFTNNLNDVIFCSIIFYEGKELIIYKDISKSQCKDTILVSVFLLFIFSLWKEVDISKIGFLVALVGLITPIVFKPVAFFWFNFSVVLGNISSKVVLTLIFYIVVSPISIFRKMLWHDALSLKSWKKDDSSLFKNRNHEFDKKDLETVF